MSNRERRALPESPYSGPIHGDRAALLGGRGVAVGRHFPMVMSHFPRRGPARPCVSAPPRHRLRLAYVFLGAQETIGRLARMLAAWLRRKSARQATEGSVNASAPSPEVPTEDVEASGSRTKRSRRVHGDHEQYVAPPVSRARRQRARPPRRGARVLLRHRSQRTDAHGLTPARSEAAFHVTSRWSTGPHCGQRSRSPLQLIPYDRC